MSNINKPKPKKHAMPLDKGQPVYMEAFQKSYDSIFWIQCHCNAV